MLAGIFAKTIIWQLLQAGGILVALFAILIGSAGHFPDAFQVTPDASWVGRYLEVRPHLLTNLVTCWALQNQVLCRFFRTIAVGTCSGVLSPNTMKVRHQHGRVASLSLCYDDTPMSGPVTLSATAWWITTRVCDELVSVDRYGNLFAWANGSCNKFCPRSTWMKTTQQNLKSMNLSLNEAIDAAQNCPLWRLLSTFGAMHS